MCLITVSRQLGSLGTEIARGVAGELRYEYADKEMVGNRIAGYGIPPLELDRFDEKKPPFWDSLAIQRRNFLYALQRAIYDLAERGNVVIVGRGGQVLLKNIPGTLHVRIFAPLAVRTERLMKSQGLDEKHAARIIRQSDHDSSGYIRTSFNADWDDPSLYDLIVNTEKISVDAGVKLIVESARSPAIQSAEKQAAEELANLVLAQQVEARLLEAVGEDVRHIDVKADNGVVYLKGAVTSMPGKERCEKALEGLPGVKRVEAQLSVVQYYPYGI